MDLNRKLQVVKAAIVSIARHDDAVLSEVHKVLDDARAFMDSEIVLMHSRRGAVSEALAEVAAEVLPAPVVAAAPLSFWKRVGAALKRMLPFLTVACMAVFLASCSKLAPPVHAQSVTPGLVTVTWTPPTQNTDGSPITGTLTFVVDEMQPCGSDAACAADQTPVAAVAKDVSGTSAQITGVPDGLHCYSVQTLELLPDGANTASTLAPVSYENMCITMTGSTAPQPSPNPPTGVAAKVSA